jgi:hypothetical protein
MELLFTIFSAFAISGFSFFDVGDFDVKEAVNALLLVTR